MARIGDVYGGNFLKAEDIKGRGDVNVVIEDVKYDEYDGKKRAVLHFRGKDKCLPLNVTNANMLAELLNTDEMDDWIGQRVALYVTRVDFQGKRVDAIRIKEPSSGPRYATPAASPPPPPPPPPQAEGELTDDDIPF